MTTLVFGYFDLNFGDDWLMHEFSKEYKKESIILVVSDVALFKSFSNNDIFKSIASVGKIKALYQCSEINIVGGSMFQESEHWIRHFSKLFLLLSVSRILRKKIKITGCNLAVINNNKLNCLLKFIFRQVGYFRVRDELSFNVLNSIYGVPYKKIELKYDLADKKIMSLPDVKQNSCSISIINNKTLDKNSYFEWLEKQIERLYLNCHVRKYTLFGFDAGNESDEKMIYEFMELIKYKFTECIFDIFIYQGDVQGFINEWGVNKYAICSRFHSYILARNCGQEYRVYGYSKKINEYISTHHSHELEYVDAS